MQATRASWDLINKKWYNQYAGQKIPAHNWLHWTGNAQNWNTMCASCHSTNLQKNYNAETDSYHTTYSSINVSCETCHGAGQHHIDYIKGADYRDGKKVAGSFMLNQKNGGQIAQINACAVCHSRKSDIGPNPIPGALFWIIIYRKFLQQNTIMPTDRQTMRTITILLLQKVKCSGRA